MALMVATFGLLALLASAAVVYWLVVITEGAYVGPTVVTWLYDRGADTYDDVKRVDRLEEFQFLGKPLLDRLEDSVGAHGLVLDVATGTGRMPLALLDIPFFEGVVVGVDSSVRMLRVAEAKTADWADRCPLIAHRAPPLPFRDASFDAVTLLEALEFLPDPVRAMAELVRVLAPGGWLLVSNRIGWEARLMPGRAFPSAALQGLLLHLGLMDVQARPWQTCYDLYWGRAPGRAARRDAAPDWQASLMCSVCGASGAPCADGNTMRCTTCGSATRREGRILRLA